MCRDFFENEEFFSLRFSLPSTSKRRFRAPNMQVLENGPQSGFFFSKMPPPRFRVDGNEGFQIR